MIRLNATSPLLLHPITLVGLGLWLVNDHLLKVVCPSDLTGKLSDVASLAVAPVILAGLSELVAPATVRRRILAVVSAWALMAAALMAGINTLPSVASAYQWTFGCIHWLVDGAASWLASTPTPRLRPAGHTMDPTDAWTIPAAGIPVALALVVPNPLPRHKVGYNAAPRLLLLNVFRSSPTTK